MRFFKRIFFPVMGVIIVALTGCNKDEVLLAGGKPVIEFDHEDGIYEVTVDEELTLAPDVENGENASYEWTLEDGTVVSRQPVWTSRWGKTGQYYVLLTVSNKAGTDWEEVRIDVVEPKAPVISLALPSEGLTILTGSDYELAPVFAGVDSGSVEWFVDGVKTADGLSFVFRADKAGVYHIMIRATNNIGATEKEFDITVADELPARMRFVPLSYYSNANVRYTVAGRPVALVVASENIPTDAFRWKVNGDEVKGDGSMYVFSSSEPGVYNVDVEAAGEAMRMEIHVEKNAGIRAGSGDGVSVLEYCPAPGQFIGETGSVGGMSADITTHEAAIGWAESRFAARKFVSLGAWGGYIIARFDRSVARGASGYDFAVMGNAIATSNEPGIVYVMQDVNGNGLPDDEWYELKGSDFSGAGVSHDYMVTYYRPGGEAMAVQWIDGFGERGTVDYIPSHTQPTYFPVWIQPDELTLYGSRLPQRNVMDPVTGMWDNPPFQWGYADNIGSDLIDGDTYGGGGQWTGFRISNAVLPDGTPVELDHIDFVKIQTGIMSKSGLLGELSTDICGIRSL